jgi:hypothetical protein
VVEHRGGEGEKKVSGQDDQVPSADVDGGAGYFDYFDILISFRLKQGCD